MPIIDMFANRYTYFPLCIAVLVMAGLLRPLIARVSGRHRLLLGSAFLLMSIVLSLKTSVEAATWKNDIILYGADMKIAPNDPKVLYHFGHAVRRKHGCKEAFGFFLKAAKIAPGYWRAQHNTTGCLINLKRYKSAVETGRVALKIRPNSHRSMYNLGVALINSNRRGEGIQHLRQAVKVAPDYASARKLLAELEP